MIFKRLLTHSLQPLLSYAQNTKKIDHAQPNIITIQHPVQWHYIPQYFSDRCQGGTLRDEDMRRRYFEFKQMIKQNNVSMEQHVRNKILGFQGNPERPIHYLNEVNVEDKYASLYAAGNPNDLVKLIADTQRMSGCKGLIPGSNFILLTKNNFPYDLQAGVEHWVVWSHSNYANESITRLLGAVLVGGWEFQVYENDPSCKSVPQISHKQLFLRKGIK